MNARNLPAGCRIERLRDSRTCEFAAYSCELGELREAGWPSEPGAVRYGSDGVPSLLHIAPGRWLVPDPGTETIVLLDSAVAAGIGASTEVEGKWSAMIVSGEGAGRILSSTVDIGAILTGRDCAAVTLFDCPAVITKTDLAYRVWVASSYTADFTAAIGRLSHCA